jgi:4-diphosphocytidyl-2-C-methyl-D-erythritol kinase
VMVTFPNCKINLGLNVIEKRKDGYHNIETVFFPIQLNDALEIISSDEETKFDNSGISIGSDGNNLCLKAFQLIKKDFPQVPKLKIHLHKAIPMGAGLGGGSADATFTLLLLNKKYNLKIPYGKLFEYALQLGSDCPFFLLNKPCFASGRGELLEPINLSLSGYEILLINPKIFIPTKEIFEQITPRFPSKKIKEIIQQPMSSWKNELVNDFEKIAFKNYPELGEIKEELYRRGAEYAAMSGSGSTMFGIFNTTAAKFPISKNYYYKWILPGNDHPKH